jgi:hypothetical protein
MLASVVFLDVYENPCATFSSRLYWKTFLKVCLKYNPSNGSNVIKLPYKTIKFTALAYVYKFDPSYFT